ncbi:phage tail tape measure protein [Salmonella enterica subsp. enterica serovar Livingstone]|nr:phage tail tape measure protein [Salmonella enterica subsp. enterica serovar Livingstone]
MANKKLNTTITIGGAVSGSLRGAFGTVEKSTIKIGAAIKHMSREQRQLNDAMKRYAQDGAMVGRMKERYQAVVGQVERLRAAQERLNRVQRASAENLAKQAQLRGQIIDTVMAGAAVAAPIKIAADREQHAIGIAKQLDGARDAAGNLTAKFWEMRKAVADLGHEIPLATNDLFDMATAGLRMGVAGDQILGFTRNVAKLASALELNPEEVADNMGKIQNVYRLTQAELVRLGDAINYLDDQNTVKGGELIDFLQRVGGSASLAKLTANDMAAIGTTLISMGESADTAATSVKALVSKMTLGSKSTKSAREAFKELGYSAQEVAKSMQLDSVKTIENFMKTVNKLPDYKKSGILVSIFGQEHVGSISKLAANMDKFGEALHQANGEMSKGSVQKEFQNTVNTTNAQMVILRNRTADVADNIGTVLLPTVNDAAKGIGRITTVVANFAAEHPGLTKAVVGTAMALTSLRVATLAAQFGFTFLKGGVLQMSSLFARMNASAVLASTRGLPAVATGIRAVGAAFISTGVGAAVAGLALAGYQIYRHWAGVKAFFGGVGEGIKSGLEPLSDALSRLYERMGPLKPVIDGVGAAVKTVFNWFTSLTEPVKYSGEELDKAGKMGMTFGKTLAAGIELVTAPITFLIDKILWVSDNIGNLTNKALEFKNAVSDVAGGAWQKTKDFFSNPFGEDESSQPAATAAPGASLPSPALANRTGNTTVNTNDQYTINVKAEPGMNEDALANKVAQKLKQQQGIRNRSMMNDGLAAP